MLIGDRLFPYPTLNSNQELSQYKETSTFALSFDMDDGGIVSQPMIKLGNVKFDLNNEELAALYKDGKIACAMIIECSTSAYRKKIPITDVSQDIEILVSDLSGSVSVSAYLYATEIIDNYSNKDFDEDYEGYTFDIEKYDILAIDDGYKFTVNTDPDLDNRVPSIFQIVCQSDANDIMTCQSTTNRITIGLSQEHFNTYNSVKNTIEFHNIMFSMMGIPALTICISEIQSQLGTYNDIEDIFDDKRWFKAVCSAYKRETGHDLTVEELEDISALELSQKVLNCASCNGLKDFGIFAFGGKGDNGGDESDE